MKELNSKNQVGATFLKIKDVILLRVDINPKTGKPAFIPQFMDEDNLSTARIWGNSSIRIFIPSNHAPLENGEMWNVRVTNYHVSKKMTRDERLYIYINVEVLDRDEHIVRSLNYTQKTLVIKKLSGTRILAEKEIPLNIKHNSWFRVNGSAVQADIVYALDKIVDLNIIHKLTAQQFFAFHQAKLPKTTLNKKVVIDTFGSYPPLPEVELENITI